MRRSRPRPCSAWWRSGAERARFVGARVGLTDEQFNRETAPNQWTYRVIAKPVLKLEQNSLNTITVDRAARTNHG
jgi:hypothetical protein